MGRSDKIPDPPWACTLGNEIVTQCEKILGKKNQQVVTEGDGKSAGLTAAREGLSEEVVFALRPE